MFSESVIENYKIGCQIGQGTYSSVYIGKDIKKNKLVAMKRIDKNSLQNLQ